MIKQVKPEDVPVGHFKSCKVQKDILQFSETDWPICDVDISDYANATSAYASYKSCAERMKVNIKVFVRSNRLFLMKGETA